jgi:hypothetical protein
MDFYSDSGSFNRVEVSGSLLASGSGKDILSVSGSTGPILSVKDLVSNENVFQIISGSTNIMKITPKGDIHISGSLIITGSANRFIVRAGTSTNTVSQIIFSNSNNVNFSFDTNGLQMSYDNGSIFQYTNAKDQYVQVGGTWGNGSLFMQPLQIYNEVDMDRVAIPIYVSNATATNSTMGLSLSLSFGLYTLDSNSFNFLTSNTVTFQDTVSAGNSSLYHGIRLWTIDLIQSLTQGHYYAAMISSITNTRGTVSNFVASQNNSSYNGIFGQPSNQTMQYTKGLGFYSATTNDFPFTIAASELYGAATGTAAANSTNTLALRPPVFYVVSNTF